MPELKRAVVLGLGNILSRDEGLGVHCLEPLRRRLGPVPGVEILDGGVLGMDLLSLVEGTDALLILDAVDARKPPGTVVELDGQDIPRFSHIKISWHQVTFQEVLQFAQIRGRLPSLLHLIGVQPADVSPGLGMSPVVEAASPEVAEAAERVLAEWGFI